MSLAATVRALAEQAKHAPNTLNAHDVRTVCLQVLEVLDLFVDVTHVSTSQSPHGGYHTLRVEGNVDNDARPFTVLAGISD